MRGTKCEGGGSKIIGILTPLEFEAENNAPPKLSGTTFKYKVGDKDREFYNDADLAD